MKDDGQRGVVDRDRGRKIDIFEHNRVIDLGCAPGSWLQVVEKIIGPSGLAVGIDLQEVRPMFGPTITTLVSDAFTTDPSLLLAPIRGKPADALIALEAPKTIVRGQKSVLKVKHAFARAKAYKELCYLRHFCTLVTFAP